MLRLLSPFLLWAFLKTNWFELKRLFIVIFAYVLALIIYADFESVFFTKHVLQFKLIKWLLIIVSITHIVFAIKRVMSKELIQHSDSEAPTKLPLTRSQKIILKYKK
tara:strand:- start:58 stop:378 length:321 start_codon:yes stop_codon:yes gene_type:complete